MPNTKHEKLRHIKQLFFELPVPIRLEDTDLIGALLGEALGSNRTTSLELLPKDKWSDQYSKWVTVTVKANDDMEGIEAKIEADLQYACAKPQSKNFKFLVVAMVDAMGNSETIIAEDTETRVTISGIDCNGERQTFDGYELFHVDGWAQQHGFQLHTFPWSAQFLVP